MGDDPAEAFEQLQTDLQEWIYNRDFGVWPTVAQASKAMGVPPLRIAEAVGRHYWMFLAGDMLTPETTRIEADGE